ncbi:MAG: S8 family serine peptidase [Acidobacteriota bacterium]
MKRPIFLLTLLLSVLCLVTATAFLQDSLRPQLEARDDQQQVIPADTLPQTFLNRNRLHKLILDDSDAGVYQQLAQAGALRDEINYGSFKLVTVDEDAAGGRAALQALPVPVRDDQNMIVLNGFVLDTSNAQPLARELPADLKQSRMAMARSTGRWPEGGLFIVQFAGPIQDNWLEALKETGADIISYVPNNAYIVRANQRASAQLLQLKDQNSHVQWLGDYEPAYKLTPSLRVARELGDSQLVQVTVQVLDGAEGDQALDAFRSTARRALNVQRVLKYRNVTVTVPASQLTELANNDGVFAIEEAVRRVRFDEAQGQIVAGNLTGNSPSGPGYLAWLGTKGFTSSQFTTFAVNVADDAYTLTGHPDLATSRVAFQNNPTNQTGAQGGHGFLNSHIIGGLNTGTGSANEDANGYNYGLGIAPWARVGVTAIFGSTSASWTTWENTAYGQGARISSNSWGFQTSTGAPVPRYTADSQSYDAVVRDAQSGTAGNQQLTVVFAAGNDGSGANTVSAPSTAKNVITVGAGENVRQTGTDGCGIANTGADSANDIISFSSRGPVNSTGGDGRVKPDIIAPGTHIEAGVPQSNYDGSSVCNQYWPAGQTLYGWSSGTSHSCPAVAGGAALVYQDFLNKSLGAPSPAMVKAYLMNSAAYMSGTGAGGNLPSNSQGMGRMDLGRAFDGASRILVDQTQVLGATGATHQVTGSVVDTGQPFRVTLAWTDAPGATTGGPWVNNLDLEVTVGGVTYRGNVFSGANSASGGTADTKNNAESVFLPAGTSGSFTVTVRATNIAGDGLPGNADTTDQDFALVVYNGSSAPPTTPTIGVSPTSLSFSGAAGGANPANQTISITNTGGGTLNWSATDNASWLTVSPASGTAPSTLTASVNTTGLAAGTYNGTITITATGATNTPLNIPVTLTVTSTTPTIGVSPASLSFTATAGGSNPANQTISITNTGGGTLSWTASDNATWLTLSPASGTAPSTLTASVSISGLAAGTYNGTITITGTGATNSPLSVPVTLTVNAASAELITNGGFETSSAPWTLSGAVRSTGGLPHSGTGYLILGGSNNASHTAYQQITVPSGTTKNLTFWLNVSSNETTTTTQFDRIFVEVRSTSGALLATLATFSNLNKTTAGVYTLRGGYSLASFAGQTVRIQFRATTDSSLTTTFRVDDVSVQ